MSRAARPGHLYVDVQIEPDERFERDGSDLVHGLELTFPQAALGAKMEVTGLEDNVIEVDVPAGIQPGETVTVRGQGVPHLNRGGRGDLIVLVQLGVPKKLSRKARKLLEELQAELNGKRQTRSKSPEQVARSDFIRRRVSPPRGVRCA